MITSGARVQVDLLGRPELQFDGAPTGTVVNVSEGQGLVSVRLDAGTDVVLVALERVMPID